MILEARSWFGNEKCSRRFSLPGDPLGNDVASRTYLLGVQTLGHGPGGDDIVHYSLTESLRHLVQLHELANVVQHVVVLGRGRGHLLDDGGHVAKDRGIQQSYIVEGS